MHACSTGISNLQVYIANQKESLISPISGSRVGSVEQYIIMYHWECKDCIYYVSYCYGSWGNMQTGLSGVGYKGSNKITVKPLNKLNALWDHWLRTIIPWLICKYRGVLKSEANLYIFWYCKCLAWIVMRCALYTASWLHCSSVYNAISLSLNLFFDTYIVYRNISILPRCKMTIC